MGIKTTNDRVLNVIENPYHKPNTALIDKLIGSAYNVVRLVAENIEYVKHVSYYLKDILIVEDYLNEIRILANEIDKIKAIYDKLAAIQTIYENLQYIKEILKHLPIIYEVGKEIDNVVAVGKNINSVVALAKYADELKICADNIDAIIKAKGYADSAKADAEKTAADRLFVENAKNQVSKDAAQVAADTAFVKANVDNFRINVEFIQQCAEYTRIYAESGYFFAEDARLYTQQAKSYRDEVVKYAPFWYGALKEPPENAPLGAEYLDISREPNTIMVFTTSGWIQAFPSYRLEYTNNLWEGINTWNGLSVFNSFAQFNEQAYFNNYTIFNNYTAFYKEIYIGNSIIHLDGDIEGTAWNGKLSTYFSDYKTEISNKFEQKDNDFSDFVQTLGWLAYENHVPVPRIKAEGTPSNVTFLRGDGQWVHITRNSLVGGKDILDADNVWTGNNSYTKPIKIGNTTYDTTGNIYGSIWDTDLKSFLDKMDLDIKASINDISGNVIVNISNDIIKNYQEFNDFKTSITETVNDNYNQFNSYKISNDIEINNIKAKNDNLSKLLFESVNYPNTITTTNNTISKSLLKADNNWTGNTNSFKNINVEYITSSNDIAAFSDIRIKREIRPIKEALPKIDALTGYHYYRTDIEKYQYGVIAQELQEVLPSAVSVDRFSDLLTVNYNQIIPLLLEGIKALNKKVTELENALKEKE